MTLRNRLLIALLAIAVVPTLLLALLLADQLGRSTARWWQPGVDRALEEAVETSRSTLTRFESTVIARADDWASALGDPPLEAAGRAELRAELRRSGLDFVFVYRERSEGRWELVERIVPEGVLAADDLDFATEIRRRSPECTCCDRREALWPRWLAHRVAPPWSPAFD